jgi:hypothetical protein
MVFSKTDAQMEIMAAEFLPHEKQLYILVADADKNIQVFQYDPESKFKRSIHTTFQNLTIPRPRSNL